MGKKRAPKGPETLYDKVKKFDETLVAELYTLSDDELKARITKYAGENDRIEAAKEADSSLKSIQEELTTAKQTYSIPLKQNRLREKLIITTLRERGKIE